MIAPRPDNSAPGRGAGGAPDAIDGEHAGAETRERHGLEGDRHQYDAHADPASQVPRPSDSSDDAPRMAEDALGDADTGGLHSSPNVHDAKQRILDWGAKPMVDKDSVKSTMAGAIPPALLVGGAVVAGLVIAKMLGRRRSVLGSVLSAAIKPTLFAALAPVAIDMVQKARSEIKRSQRGPEGPPPGSSGSPAGSASHAGTPSPT